jgi:phenylacetate-CoA ligase
MQTLTQLSSWHDVSALDYLPVEQLRDLQLTRLQALIHRVYGNVKAYRARMDEAGVKPEDIHSLKDAAKLPFTYKTDLRDNYPFGLFAAPMEKIVRLHASSGTTGKPIVVAYTQNDIDVWSQVMLRSLVAGGVGRNDMVQNAYGYGLFTGGLGVHYGAEALGATVVPISGGNTERQILIMKDFGVTVITCTPSYFLHLIDKAEEMGIDMRNLKLRAGVFGAEPWSEPMRKAIEERSGIEAFDIYGLSEIIGPGVSMECPCHRGLHVFEDHFLAEIIDPDTGEVREDGEEGEIVFTTLTKEAFPVLRYRTRDISRLCREKCECGRTIVRMERVRRRSDDMFIIRGVNVFPSQIEAALLEVEGTLPHYQIILTRDGSLDNMTVQVEVTEKFFTDEIRGLESLRRQAQAKIESTLGLHVTIKLVEPKTLQRSEGKAKRVLDQRTV